MWVYVPYQSKKFLSYTRKAAASTVQLSGSQKKDCWPSWPYEPHRKAFRWLTTTGCTAHDVPWRDERLPREQFAVATPATAFQDKIKHSWAAHGAGTHAGFSTAGDEHCPAVSAQGRMTRRAPIADLEARAWVMRYAAALQKAMAFFLIFKLCLGEFLSSVWKGFFEPYKPYCRRRNTLLAVRRANCNHVPLSFPVLQIWRRDASSPWPEEVMLKMHIQSRHLCQSLPALAQDKVGLILVVRN